MPLVALLAGCTSVASVPLPSATSGPQTSLPAPSQTPSGSPTSTLVPTTAEGDALTYWNGGATAEDSDERGATLLGIGRLYSNQTPTYEAYMFIGTVGSRCLVLIGYDSEYNELPLPRVPEIEVVLFNRFGLPKDRGSLFFDRGTPTAMKASLAEKQRACE